VLARVGLCAVLFVVLWLVGRDLSLGEPADHLECLRGRPAAWLGVGEVVLALVGEEPA